MADEDEELLAPFLALRPAGRRAARLQEHAAEDARRGRRHLPRRAASLSRDEIAQAAIGIADAEGAEAVSMRRIARELNAGTMSLYWHVASKEELLDLMIDTVQGEQQPPERSGDWQADLAGLARASRATLHQHRWMLDFMGGRPPVGPKSLRSLERTLAVLDGLPLDKATAVTIVMTVMTYVLGAVLREVQEMNGERHLQEQFAHLSEEQKETAMREFTERLRASGRFPHLAGMIEQRVDPDAPDTRDDRFEYGLGCLLDGIAARLPAGAAGSGEAGGAL